MGRKSPDAFLKQIKSEGVGKLKIYIGAAPGVGKTYHMLRDANDIKTSGIDIVIGLVETYDRKDTAAQIGDIEIIPLKKISYKDVVLSEMDVDAIIARKPEVVVIDELAHTNAPKSKNNKRYEDVLEILENGISVMTAVNIQHIESLNDYVNRMTGVRVRETVPDKLLNIAKEVEVIDISPTALRERLRSGKIYSDDKVETALENFFRVGNLSALRELTLREVANEVDESLLEYKNEKNVEGLVGAQEKILVCVNLRFNAEYLIRRGYRIAKMFKADMFVIYVDKDDEIRSMDGSRKFDSIIDLCNNLDANFKVIKAIEPVSGIIKFAKENAITQIIIGQSARTRLNEIIKGSIVRRIMKNTKYIDVLVVSDPKR